MNIREKKYNLDQNWKNYLLLHYLKGKFSIFYTFSGISIIISKSTLNAVILRTVKQSFCFAC